MKKFFILFFAIILFFISNSLSYAQVTGPKTYYISSSTGDDSNDGLSEATPWKTFSKVRSSLSNKANPGDSILLKRGDSWDEELSIKLIGTASSPIIIDAYGIGAKPLIYGDCHTNSWQVVDANVSSLDIQYANGLGVLENGIKLIADSEVNNAATLSATISSLQPGHWFIFWSGSTERVYVYPTTPGTSDLMVLRDENVHIASGSAYVNINNLNLTKAFHGISIWSSDHVNLSNNDGSYMLQYSYYYDHSNNGTIENNTSYMTRDSSLYMWYGSGFTVRNNNFGNIQATILGSYEKMEASVVGLGRITDSLVERNYLHDAEQWSALDWEWNDNVTVRYNYMYKASISTPYGNGVKVYGNIVDLAWEGTPVESGAGTGIASYDDSLDGTLTIYNNVLYRAHSSQIKFSANGKVKFRNNIFVDYNTNNASNLPIVEVTPQAVAANSFDSDYNIFYIMDGSIPRFNWDGKTYTGLAAYQAASGQELHSIVANPQFISDIPLQPSDFQLKSTSPAINFGINLKTAGIISMDDLYLDYAGTSIPQGTAPDAGAYELVSTTVPPPSDTTPPTVSITAPATGATVSGTNVRVSITANDNVAVTGVQLKLNGVNLGGEGTVAPYVAVWDTTLSPNGIYSLTAVAKDAAGNITTSSPIQVTVTNITTVIPPVVTGGGGGGGGGIYTPQPVTGLVTKVSTPFLGCDNRTTGFSRTTGKSCVGNPSTSSGQVIPPTTTIQKYNLGTVTLRNGSRGEAVKELQRFLNDTLNLGLVLDGKLGPKTIAVIKKWQKSKGLVPDGLVGAKTKAMMNSGI